MRTKRFAYSQKFFSIYTQFRFLFLLRFILQFNVIMFHIVTIWNRTKIKNGIECKSKKIFANMQISLFSLFSSFILGWSQSILGHYLDYSNEIYVIQKNRLESTQNKGQKMRTKRFAYSLRFRTICIQFRFLFLFYFILQWYYICFNSM